VLTLKANTGHARNGLPDAAYVWNQAVVGDRGYSW
jgi:hypothetical protein